MLLLVPVFSSGSIIRDGKKPFPLTLAHLIVCKSVLVVACTSAGGQRDLSLWCLARNPCREVDAVLHVAEPPLSSVLQGAAGCSLWPCSSGVAAAQHEQDQTCHVLGVGSQRL